MKNYSQGDIVFVPFPFSDKLESKKRPAVIISKNSINNPLFTIAKITSVIRNENYSFLIDNDSFTVNPLPKLCEVRTMEIFTIHKSEIIKKLTSFNPGPLKEILDKVKENFS